MRLKIIVDRDLCIGAAKCVDAAPKVFRLDEKRKAVVIDPLGNDSDAIQEAAESCPTQAITLVDEETGKQLFP